MTRAQFEALPLVRRWVSIDPDTKSLTIHEVRRHDASGLTLTNQRPA